MPETPQPEQVTTNQDALTDSLARIVMSVVMVDEAKAELKESVLEARDNGATWSQIGESVGMSSSGANKRWSRYLPDNEI